MATKKTPTTTTRARKRRSRATNEEMQRRQDAVIEALSASKKPLTINEIARRLKLTYSATNSLLRMMVAEGKIESAGRVGRNLTFRALDQEEPEYEDFEDEEVQEDTDEVSPVSVTPMRPVPIAGIVGQLLLGSQVEVVGLRLENDDTIIDLRSPEGTTVSVKAVTQS